MVWLTPYRCCLGVFSFSTGAESTAVYSIIANKSLKHWGRANVGAVPAKLFTDIYLYDSFYCCDVGNSLLNLFNVVGTLSKSVSLCVLLCSYKAACLRKSGCRIFGRKMNPMSVLQLIKGILLLSLCFAKHMSYPDILHTHAYTHRL